MPPLFRFFLILLLFLLLVLLLLTYALYRYVFYSPQRGQNDPHRLVRTDQTLPYEERVHVLVQAMEKRPFEDVRITSRDHLVLHGRLYLQREHAPLHICFHGYRGTPVRDFAGGGAFYLSLGHNLLLVDQRAHGESEGHTITFGALERFDVLSWLSYAGECFKGEPIFLTGISMGAATVLMASGLPLPPNVLAVMADCPYTSPEAILKKVAKDKGIPVSLAYPLLKLSARLFGHFSLEGASAADAVKDSPVPILLIHGEEDRFVPFAMSREIKEAAPEKVTLVPFPRAGHGYSFLVDEEGYKSTVKAFLEKRLSEWERKTK